jgi:hypothetical protein
MTESVQRSLDTNNAPATMLRTHISATVNRGSFKQQLTLKNANPFDGGLDSSKYEPLVAFTDSLKSEFAHPFQLRTAQCDNCHHLIIARLVDDLSELGPTFMVPILRAELYGRKLRGL